MAAGKNHIVFASEWCQDPPWQPGDASLKKQPSLLSLQLILDVPLQVQHIEEKIDSLLKANLEE